MAERLGDRQHRLPQAAMHVDDQLRARVAQGFELLEERVDLDQLGTKMEIVEEMDIRLGMPFALLGEVGTEVGLFGMADQEDDGVFRHGIISTNGGDRSTAAAAERYR